MAEKYEVKARVLDRDQHEWEVWLYVDSDGKTLHLGYTDCAVKYPCNGIRELCGLKSLSDVKAAGGDYDKLVAVIKESRTREVDQFAWKAVSQ